MRLPLVGADPVRTGTGRLPQDVGVRRVFPVLQVLLRVPRKDQGARQGPKTLVRLGTAGGGRTEGVEGSRKSASSLGVGGPRRARGLSDDGEQRAVRVALVFRDEGRLVRTLHVSRGARDDLVGREEPV